MRGTQISYKRLGHNRSGFTPDLPHALFARRFAASSNFFSLALCLLIAGCESTPYHAPVSDRAVAEGQKNADTSGIPTETSPRRANVYIVKKGDTLYSIATGNGINPKDLAEWNDIPDPGAIHIGQEIYLSRPGEPAQPSLFAIHESAPPSPAVTRQGTAQGLEAKQLVPAGKLKTEPKVFKLPYSEQAIAQLKGLTEVSPPVTVVKAAPTIEKNPGAEINTISIPPEEAIKDADHVEWIWPAKGKVSELFSESTKGIDIAGRQGQAVTASAGGKVVYSGTGLRGYGKLIIIKHNNTYLSAYAHNSKLLVKEGETVVKGQKIAEMGNTDAGLVKLHFEIRKNGKPVDPLKHLPGISG